MRLRVIALVVFGLAAVAAGLHPHAQSPRVADPGRAFAQGVVMQRTVSLGMAKTIADATLAACKAKGYNTSVAVVDRAGHVLVIMRSEQATAQTA